MERKARQNRAKREVAHDALVRLLMMPSFVFVRSWNAVVQYVQPTIYTYSKPRAVCFDAACKKNSSSGRCDHI